jgi:hypothetical protein
MKNKIICFCGLITSLFVHSQDLGNSNCDSLLLVSGWRSDNVHIHDGCDGSFIRNLAITGLMDGPQAIFETPDNDIVVVSESNHKLIQFDRQTLSQATVVSGDDPTTIEIEPSLLQNPISALLDDNNDLLLSSYSSNKLIKVDTGTWQQIQEILPATTQHINGADIGNAYGPDGQLYIPGFNSDNIIKVNLSNFTVTEVVSSGGGGLNAPRAIVFKDDFMFVSSEQSNEILKYDSQGNFIESFLSISRPVGMIKDGENHMLVIGSSSRLYRINLNDASQELIIPAGTGDVQGATFVYRIQKLGVQTSTVANQHWMIGVGEIVDNSIHVSTLTTTRNGDFGVDFNPDNVVRQDWGSLNINFTDCSHGDMDYDSFQQADDYEFGSGGYEVQKLAANLAGQECLDLGMENTTSKLWMSGTWYGGASRSGEGFLIDVLSDTSAVVTWYTYLPLSESN